MNGIEAGFRFLKAAAFFDIKLPRKMSIYIAPLEKAWGYCVDKPARIDLDSNIRTGGFFLKVMAHEMCHAALNEAGAHGTKAHGKEFKALARIVCRRMGWKTKGF